ncbi:hypothetical protein [Oryzifoliimicrobium ureilyticus]|uniref:hypothetical protein n=1 Tax=Oryzifoliimicrobium ureilyticus TaxID=3113724 RepID=UPI003076122B
MKGLLRIFRPSKKLLIILVAVLILNAAAGGAAYYFGFIGGHAETGVAEKPNGLACTDVNLVTIKHADRLWVRKFIRTESTDGLTRVKTALRVARAVYQAQKDHPDLVQVVVLDQNGPTLRSDMRGRAIAADIIYAPHPDDILKNLGQKTFTARYFDSGPALNGEFFGDRVELPEDKIEAMNAALTESTDCVDPTVVAATDKKGAEAHGGEKGGKGKEAGAHGEASAESHAEGESSDHGGREKPADGHEEPVKEVKAEH